MKEVEKKTNKRDVRKRRAHAVTSTAKKGARRSIRIALLFAVIGFISSLTEDLIEAGERKKKLKENKRGN